MRAHDPVEDLRRALPDHRLERGSWSTWRPSSERGEVLGNPVSATAMLNHVLHRSPVLKIRRDSYRPREKKGPSLLGPRPLPSREVRAER